MVVFMTFGLAYSLLNSATLNCSSEAKTKAMNTSRGCGMHQAAAAAVVESTDIINRSWISAFDTCRNQTFSGDYISKALESQEASLLFCLLAAWLAGSLYMLYSSISWKTFFLLPPSPHTVQWATQKGTHYTQSLSCSKPWQQSELCISRGKKCMWHFRSCILKIKSVKTLPYILLLKFINSGLPQWWSACNRLVFIS